MIEAIRRRLSGQARLADADTPMPDVEGAPNEHVLFQAWIAWHRQRLLNAAERRPERRDVVISADGRREQAWELHERRVMLAGVNAARERMGKGPVELAVVERVERAAQGHCGYVDKFALHCAELVMDRAPWAHQ